MKKKCLAVLLCGLILWNIPVYGEETSKETTELVGEEGSLDFLSVLAIPKKEGSEKLDLDTATQKALAHSTS